MFERDADDGGEGRVFTRRALLLGAGQLGVFAYIANRLHQLQVLDASHYAALAEANRFTTVWLAPERGRILDRHGLELAGNAATYRVLLVPALAGNLEMAFARLAELLELDQETVGSLLERSRRQSPHQPMVIAADLDWDSVVRVVNAQVSLPGVSAERFGARRYRHGGVVGKVTGLVGAVERAALDDDPVLRTPAIRIGRSGIEATLDARLRGHAGRVRYEVDARGRIVREVERRAPTSGSDVAITVSTELQGRVAEMLASHRRAAAVVMDVQTGEVLAMVSQPGYDPSQLLQDTDGEVLRALGQSPDQPMVDRTIQGLYAPGSVFKPATALAALAAGIDPDERVRCTGVFELADSAFRCWKRSGHGDCDLIRAMAESCDCYFYEMATRIGADAVARAARALGLGQSYPRAIVHQKQGVVPDAAWKHARLGEPWLAGETVLASIGQGYVLTTPLQLAVLTARVASGRAVEPVLDRAAVPAGGWPLLAPRDRTALEQVRKGLDACVNKPGGTGSRARLDGTVRLAGKTGTAQVSRLSAERADEDLAWARRDHALFVAYAPAERPRYAVSVIVEHGGGGGAVAAPLAREIMETILERDPEGDTGYPSGPIDARAASVEAEGR
jgi:penicillin-binding protein 2